MEDHNPPSVPEIPPDVLQVARALVASGLTALRSNGESEQGTCSERPPYTVPEAAAQLRVHESTVYRAIKDGELDAYSVGSSGRAIRIPASDLDAFKARRKIRPAASAGEASVAAGGVSGDERREQQVRLGAIEAGTRIGWRMCGPFWAWVVMSLDDALALAGQVLADYEALDVTRDAMNRRSDADNRERNPDGSRYLRAGLLPTG